MINPISSHLILVAAESQEKACLQVEEFFKSTLLIRYDRVEIQGEDCCSAEDSSFTALIAKGLAANTATLDKFITEFKSTGFQTVEDLSKVEHGYPSKLLHIITHFLDGFIGVDTNFYNLIDDSHWLPEKTTEAIKEYSRQHWLIKVHCYSESPEKASLIRH